MNPEEMLKELGLSRHELDDTLAKFHSFLASLDKRQHAAVTRSLPTMAEAVAAFGPDVKADDLRKLLEGEGGRLGPVTLCMFPLHQRKSKM
jgi:hypothetical protein